MEKQATLIIANSEVNSDLYYTTGFLAPDPFVFIEIDGRKMMLMNDLELDRAKAQARVDDVLSLSGYYGKLKAAGKNGTTTLDVLDVILKEHGVRKLLVPPDFGFRHADGLQSKGYVLTTKDDPFFEERMIKGTEEVQAIRKTQEAVEIAVEQAIEVLREAKIAKDVLIWKEGVLKAEDIRKIIHLKLMELDCVGQHTIVAPGIQGCDPHNEGSGPIRPNQSIVLDVFPRSSTSRYFADMSRTVVKGRASDALKKLYDTVHDAQEEGVTMVRNGVQAREIHLKIHERFKEKGYHTGMKNGRMEGFFHGTGHGLGLDIHEPPRIGDAGWILKTGEVVTVEPGLYYPDIGAVRIEDMVLVTGEGCTNLTTFPKFLEV